MKKIALVIMAVLLAISLIGCNNSNPLTDPSNPLNPANPNSPLNPNNPNNPANSFSNEEAAEIIANMIDGLDKAKLADGLGNNGGMYQLSEYLVVTMTDGTEKKYETNPEGQKQLENDLMNSTTDLRKIESMDISMTFNKYSGDFKTDVSTLKELNGTVYAKIVPTAVNVSMSGTIPTVELTAAVFFTSSDLSATFTDSNDTYIFSLNNFLTLANTTIDEDQDSILNFYLPEEENTQTISVKKGSTTRTIGWDTIALLLEENTAFYPNGKIEETITDSYYNHFGTQHFLLALYDAYEENGAAGVTIGTTEYENNTYTLPLTLEKYMYYMNDANQLASGNVTLVFSLATPEEEFAKATGFTINGNVTLSDASHMFKEKNITFDTQNVTIGSGSGDSGIEFSVNENSITGIKHYGNSDDDEINNVPYAAAEHEFTFSN